MKKLLCLLLACLLLLASAAPGLAESGHDQRLYLLEKIRPLEEGQIPPTPMGMRHFLLISMDKWQNNVDNPGYNDGLVLLTLDELTGRVMVTSFIRDMLIIRPDGNPGRVNRVVREYGVQALLDTLNRHFGLHIEKYVLMDWRHIMEIIDAVGGVDVPLTSAEVSRLKNWSVPPDSTEPRLYRPGTYHLNGFAAVVYMRIRKTRASNDVETDSQDFGRTYRARLVLSNIAEKISDYSFSEAGDLLSRILKIWDELYDKHYTYPGIRNNNIFVAATMPSGAPKKRSDTNITMADLLDALSAAYSLRHAKIEQCRLPFDGTVRPYTYAGGAGQLLDFEENRRLLHEFMFSRDFIVTE